MADFYLSSTELREGYEPRACIVLKRLRSELRDDLALVSVEPPLPGSVYSSGGDLDQLVLASKHEGVSLFSHHGWPLSVYICTVKEGAAIQDDTLRSADLEIVDWGQVGVDPR